MPNTPTAGSLVTKLTQENPSPLLNNASQTTLPPGSTFKIVTTSTWYAQSAAHTPQTPVYSPQPLKLPNDNFLNDDNDEPCGNGNGQTPVITAFAAVLQHPVRQHRHAARRPGDRVDGRASTVSTPRWTSPA